MTELTHLTAIEAVEAIRAGRITALDLTRACLSRIDARDGTIRAWLALNPEAEAEAARIGPGDPRPLAGLPVGIKDVFDTADLPTTFNSPLFQNHRPAADAAAVAQLRAAGAIIIGKTDTTEFAAAGRDAATANPLDPRHTPGGSSAGSAAAVADFHVPLALATQTGGSTIRPASYCGIVGMKPSFGLISTEGLKRYAASFDTVGIHVRCPRDLGLVASVFDLGTPPADPAPDPDPAPAQMRLGLCLTPYADVVTPEARDALDRAARQSGATIVPFDLPREFVALDDLHRAVMYAEGAASFLPLAGLPGLHRDFADRIATRNDLTRREAFAARDRLADLAQGCEALMDAAGIDAIIAPAAPSPAPLGRRPGDPVLNALWTAMQMPCLTLPVAAPPGRLPVGIQLIGRRGTDADLIGLAIALAPHLAFTTRSHVSA
jgi:Asp-tRNA(Asn)/Glu-tRNA(Gln) amidotransferase A subunit family amidase